MGIEDHSPSHRGFTLVELLVVIAIIGTFVGLLLPAVQVAREAGRLSICRNNIKQLALSLHNYESARACLPNCLGKESTASPGWNPGPSYGLTSKGRSWIARILPFIENEGLYNRIQFNINMVDSPTNLDIYGTAIAAIICPSDTSQGLINDRADLGDYPTAGRKWGTTNYKAVAGDNWSWGDSSNLPSTGRWSTDSANKGNGFDYGNGIICRNSGNLPGNVTKLSHITDGLSSTFALGEAVPEWCQWTTWVSFNHTTGTCAIPLNYQLGIVDLYAKRGDYGRNYSFFSRHIGGAMFALADGSATFVTNDIGITVYRQLATIDSGVRGSLP